MKFSEAMRALEEGKSVRCKSWGLNEFWSFKSGGTMYTTIPDIFTLATRQWELYEEKAPRMNFSEVVRGLKLGKRFRRVAWEVGRFLFVDEYKNPRCNFYGGEPWPLIIEDFEEADWVEYKE